VAEPVRVQTDQVASLAATIARQDFAGLADHVHPRVRFRALTPNNTFGLFGASAATETMQNWFGDASTIEVQADETEPIVDRVRLSYRFKLQEDGVWKVVEQQAMCQVEDGLITDISIVCSGFRPLE
jgi:hypothetical protein